MGLYSFTPLSSVECAVAQAVCTLKQQKADWDTAKRVLGESGFMKSLLEFDKDHIPEAVMKNLRKYIDNPEFTPEAVAKQSKAAQSLCMWCRAMEVYDRIAKVFLCCSLLFQLHRRACTVRAVSVCLCCLLHASGTDQDGLLEMTRLPCECYDV